MDYQRMIIVGNATKHAEVHHPKRKAVYADFTVAVSRTKEHKTLFPIRVFGKLPDTYRLL